MAAGGQSETVRESTLRSVTIQVVGTVAGGVLLDWVSPVLSRKTGVPSWVFEMIVAGVVNRHGPLTGRRRTNPIRRLARNHLIEVEFVRASAGQTSAPERCQNWLIQDVGSHPGVRRIAAAAGAHGHSLPVGTSCGEGMSRDVSAELEVQCLLRRSRRRDAYWRAADSD